MNMDNSQFWRDDIAIITASSLTVEDKTLLKKVANSPSTPLKLTENLDLLKRRTLKGGSPTIRKATPQTKAYWKPLLPSGMHPHRFL